MPRILCYIDICGILPICKKKGCCMPDADISRKEYFMLQYLIVCPLVFLAGFVDSIAGGGGLISLPAYIIAGVPAHFALGTNKMSSTLGTSVSTWRYLKNGYLKEKRLIITTACACLMSLTGSYIGSSLSLLVSDTVIKHMMMVVLPVVAFYVLRNKNMGAEETVQKIPARHVLLICVLAALVIGMYDGFYGPGTGTFLLLVLTGAAHLNVREASAMTKVLNLSSNVMALANFLLNGTVYYGLGLAAAVFCIAGHYIGSGLVISNGQKIVRPLILVVLVILFVKILLGI